jgi:hypothetical protein
LFLIIRYDCITKILNADNPDKTQIISTRVDHGGFNIIFGKTKIIFFFKFKIKFNLIINYKLIY